MHGRHTGFTSHRKILVFFFCWQLHYMRLSLIQLCQLLPIPMKNESLDMLLSYFVPQGWCLKLTPTVSLILTLAHYPSLQDFVMLGVIWTVCFKVQSHKHVCPKWVHKFNAAETRITSYGFMQDGMHCYSEDCQQVNRKNCKKGLPLRQLTRKNCMKYNNVHSYKEMVLQTCWVHLNYNNLVSFKDMVQQPLWVHLILPTISFSSPSNISALKLSTVHRQAFLSRHENPRWYKNMIMVSDTHLTTGHISATVCHLIHKFISLDQTQVFAGGSPSGMHLCWNVARLPWLQADAAEKAAHAVSVPCRTGTKKWAC